MQTVEAQKISNKGTDFWAAFGHHLQMEVLAWFPTDSPKLVFDFCAEKDARVVVTLDGTGYREEYFVPANSVVTSKKMPLGPNREPGTIYEPMLYTRTSNWPGGTNSEGIFKNKGIHIQSDVPIVVFKRMYFSASSAATMLFPTDSWGYHYQCLAASQSFVGPGGGTNPGAFSYFYIIANQNNTKVRINPSVPSRSGLPANVPFDVVLQQGEVYQFLAGQSGSGTMHDVNGTTITSVSNSDGKCLPFAAFVGSSATAIACPPQNPNTYSLEHLFQQVFPQQAWGKRYFTVPTSSESDASVVNFNTFRVMVKDPATVVIRNGVPLTGLSRSFYEFRSNTADVIEADQPVQVAQILPSQNACSFIGKVDPDYMILSPVEQAISQARFMRSALQNVDCNYLTVTLPTAGLSSLKIDGVLNNFTRSYPHPNYPGYSVVIRRWDVKSNTDPRPPQQCSIECDSAFNAFTYGLGQAESYMYNAGTYINNLNGYPFFKNKYNTSDTANQYTCANTPVELSVWLRYKPTKILWELSKLADTISPAADVTLNAPKAVDSTKLKDLTYYRYRLPGSYLFTRPGNFTIPVFASEPTVEQCDNTEQIPYQIEVHDTLHTDFSLLYESCKASQIVQFEGKTKFSDSSLIQRWEWTFISGTDTGTATGQKTSYNYQAGTNRANIVAVDFAGCAADTTKSFAFTGKPAVPAFTITTNANCVNNTIQFAETNPQPGMQRWFWDFGNGDTTTLSVNGKNASHIYQVYDTLTVKHVVKDSSNCISDTAIQQLIVYGNPAVTMSDPSGCLPGNKVINFTSQVVTPESQAIQAYLWNFGDPNANASNPNTSGQANPSHLYSEGSYTVLLKVTTEKGCITDSTLKIGLYGKPAIQFGPVLSPVCLNTPAPVSVAKAAITNGLPGTGIYKGPGTDSQGNFNPATAGVGNHTIWYVFTATQGCVDSAAATIWVHAVSAASFAAPAGICLDQAATFTDQSTIDISVDVNAKITTWAWNFGDGNPDVVYSNGLPFSKSFTLAKSYTVTLTTATADGCKSTVFSKPLVVNPLPVADFALPSGVCMPGGQAVFTNKSSISDASQLSYQWNFGDGGTSTAVNGSHVYVAIQSYNVNLKTTSAFGCFADTTKALPASTFSQGPIVDFDMSDDKVCEATVVNFTDKSSSVAGITGWDWTFGDGAKSAVQNPAKSYSKFGTYQVALRVTDKDGCVAVSTPGKSVEVLINPQIDAGPDIFTDENTAVVLKATATNAQQLKFLWQPAGLLSDPTLLQPTYVASQDQVFVLTATDLQGLCTAQDEMKVVVRKKVFIPNAFSPNGDGINDVWVIRNLSDYPQSSVYVFDRYGRQVFASQGYSTPWDGTAQGRPVPAGTYYYIIHIKQGEAPLTGSITVLR